MAERQRWCLQRRDLCLVLRLEAYHHLRDYLEHPNVIPNWDDVECVTEHWDGLERESQPTAAATKALPQSPASSELSLVTTDRNWQEEALDPITLDALYAPYITACGHVYSALSIVKHILVSSERIGAETEPAPTPRGGDTLCARCPICADWVTLDELRPFFYWRSAVSPAMNPKVRMRLLCKPRGGLSCLMLPRDCAETPQADLLWSMGARATGMTAKDEHHRLTDAHRPCWNEADESQAALETIANRACCQIMAASIEETPTEQIFPLPENSRYYRVVLGRFERMQRLFRERALAMEQHGALDESMGLAFTVSINRERHRLEELCRAASIERTLLASSIEGETSLIRWTSGSTAHDFVPIESTSRMQVGTVPSSTKTTWLTRDKKATEANTNPVELVGLYQIADGRQVFLHPQNYRQLLRRYGSVNKLPCWIQGSLLRCYECRVGGSVSRTSGTCKPHRTVYRAQEEPQRRTANFPAHLPRGCAYLVYKLVLDDEIVVHADNGDDHQGGTGNDALRRQLDGRSVVESASASSSGLNESLCGDALVKGPKARRSIRPQQQRQQQQQQPSSQASSSFARSQRRSRRSSPREQELSLREAFEQERQHIIEAHGGAQMFFRGAAWGLTDQAPTAQRRQVPQRVVDQANAHELAERIEAWPALGSELESAANISPRTMEPFQPATASYARVTQVRGGYFPALRECYGLSEADNRRLSPTRDTERREKHASL
ncbi:hypothetical protein F1559_000716 [Cyanidiococcus yangmingshanensis]|uniref:Uncharacterized protein n=1 Tax=Cyanidiococcus yangmingshanensis TaxID=2690220 RepID=A0A7J7ID87_9RHOD|nr:hypothetical protein F1559_000716 [Cyanidiococcus yangmingshanensis]